MIVLGIDLGLTRLTITSDGEKYASQRLYLKYQKYYIIMKNVLLERENL